VLDVVDAAVVVCEPDEKKLPALQVILKDLADRGLPHILFLNKIDKASGRIRDTLLPDGTHVFEIGRKLEAQGFNTPENEQETLQATAERLFRAAGLNTLRKWRSFLSLQDGITVMIDRFTHIRGDRVEDLVISEIEFEERVAALAADFEPPLWIGREITGDHRWSNFALCREGIPLRAEA